jgi:hypothetical protein
MSGLELNRFQFLVNNEINDKIGKIKLIILKYLIT